MTTPDKRTMVDQMIAQRGHTAEVFDPITHRTWFSKFPETANPVASDWFQSAIDWDFLERSMSAAGYLDEGGFATLRTPTPTDEFLIASPFGGFVEADLKPEPKPHISQPITIKANDPNAFRQGEKRPASVTVTDTTAPYENGVDPSTWMAVPYENTTDAEPTHAGLCDDCVLDLISDEAVAWAYAFGKDHPEFDPEEMADWFASAMDDVLAIYHGDTEEEEKVSPEAIEQANKREADPNYAAMSTCDMLEAIGDNAEKWATAYCQMNPTADWGTMLGWFANAIENSTDVRHFRTAKETVSRDAVYEVARRLFSMGALCRQSHFDSSGPNTRSSDMWLGTAYDYAATLVKGLLHQ